MKIVMIGHKRIPSREGGVEVVVEELATRMTKMGHDVTVYNRKGSHVAGIKGNDCKKNYEYKGVKIKTIFTLDAKNFNALVYSFLATIQACFSNAEIIHFHAEGSCAMIPLAKLFRKKCVATIHGLDWKRAKWGSIATHYLLFGERMAAKYAHQLIVLSEDMKSYFKHEYERDVVVISNGVHQPIYENPSLINTKYGLNGQDYLLYLARLVPEKGVHTLIEAYQKSGLSVPLVIAGGGSHSDKYCHYIENLSNQVNEFAIRNATGQKIIMTGFVQGKELEELYSNTLLYILPSEIEGMPISLLEAMSYGNICLTSDIPENMAVIDRYGFSFKTSDADDLAKSLTELYDNMAVIRNDREYTRENIQEYILKKYNWDDVTKRTLSCYENING